MSLVGKSLKEYMYNVQSVRNRVSRKLIRVGAINKKRYYKLMLRTQEISLE